MNENGNKILPVFLIIMFFILFLCGPVAFFYAAYRIYNIKNLPIIKEADIDRIGKGGVIIGLLILDAKNDKQLGDKLAIQYEDLSIKHYRKFNIRNSVKIGIYENRKQLKIDKFPDRFDYGPKLNFFYPLLNSPKLEKTMTHFREWSNIGKITKYIKSEKEISECTYLVIYDSISYNRAKVIDTISITMESSTKYDSAKYSFDTTNYANSKSENKNKLFEIGLSVGDTIVGEFKISNDDSNIITPQRIYCYGNPKIIWEYFLHDNIFFIIICSILILL